MQKNILIVTALIILSTGGFLTWHLWPNGEAVDIEKEIEKTDEKKVEEVIVEESEEQEEGKGDENDKKKSEKGVAFQGSVSSTEDLPNQIVDCLYETSGVPSPKSVAFNLKGEEYWVTSLMNKSRGVVVFDTETGEHKKDIVLPGGGGVEVIFGSDGGSVYVSQMETGRVYEIDSKTKEITRTLETQSAWTKVVAISEDEKTLFASNWSGNSVSVIDLEKGKLSKNIQTVTNPRGIYPTKNGRYLYVAGFKNGEIEKINLETTESNIIYRNEGAMRHIVADEEKGVLYFSDMANGKIYRVYLEDDKVEQFVKTERNPNTIALTDGGRVLVVSNRGVNNPESYYIPGPEWGTLMFFNTATGDILDVVVGGNQPTAVDIYNNKLVYSNFLDGSVVLCKIPDYEEFLKGDGGTRDVYRDYIRK